MFSNFDVSVDDQLIVKTLQSTEDLKYNDFDVVSGKGSFFSDPCAQAAVLQ